MLRVNGIAMLLTALGCGLSIMVWQIADRMRIGIITLIYGSFIGLLLLLVVISPLVKLYSFVIGR